MLHHEKLVPQKPEWKQPNYKDIVRDEARFAESLPLPIVNYPRVYGTWILFQEDSESQPLLCACTRKAATNFLKLHFQSIPEPPRKPLNLVHLFMRDNVRTANRLGALSLEEFASLPLFRDCICHVCTRHVPAVRWSNLDEHSFFLQHLGWYFHYALYAAGISPHGDLLRTELDPELAAIAQLDRPETYRRIRDLMARYPYGNGSLDKKPSKYDGLAPGRPAARALHQALRTQTKQLHRVIEERFRRSLGFPSHGKTGGSEILLGWIICSILKDQKVMLRARPEFLGGLELDIYIPEMQIAIEYQGEQHYEPFSHLGGARHLRAVQQRDQRKAELCRSAGVDLRYITVADKLTEDYIRTILSRP